MKADSIHPLDGCPEIKAMYVAMFKASYEQLFKPFIITWHADPAQRIVQDQDTTRVAITFLRDSIDWDIFAKIVSRHPDRAPSIRLCKRREETRLERLLIVRAAPNLGTLCQRKYITFRQGATAIWSVPDLKKEWGAKLVEMGYIGWRNREKQGPPVIDDIDRGLRVELNAKMIEFERENNISTGDEFGLKFGVAIG